MDKPQTTDYQVFSCKCSLHSVVWPQKWHKSDHKCTTLTLRVGFTSIRTGCLCMRQFGCEGECYFATLPWWKVWDEKGTLLRTWVLTSMLAGLVCSLGFLPAVEHYTQLLLYMFIACCYKCIMVWYSISSFVLYREAICDVYSWKVLYYKNIFC